MKSFPFPISNEMILDANAMVMDDLDALGVAIPEQGPDEGDLEYGPSVSSGCVTRTWVAGCGRPSTGRSLT